ncbi:MAG: RNA-binding cell elongation regulator Jag/EloR [Candidatus Binatia bacterium]
MDAVEAEGNSIDEAIENALQTLGVPRERAEIEILANAARGLFGIGGRKARVRAVRRAPLDAESFSRPGPPATPPEAAPAAPAAITTAMPPAGENAPERAAQILREILRRIGVEATVIVRHEEDQDLLDLTGDSSGVLIGRRGTMLDALEYFLNRVIARESAAGRIVVDSQNYRARRRQSIEELARRTAEQAKKKRRPIALNPMSPRDRRIVHMVLQGDPSLTTKSSGKGYFRKLIVIPAGESRAQRGPAVGPAESAEVDE